MICDLLAFHEAQDTMPSRWKGWFSVARYLARWPSSYARLMGLLELLRGSITIMAENLPTGELVLLTKDVLEKHVQLERERAIDLEDVRQVVINPDAIYDDGRPTHTAKGKYFAVKLKSDPWGTVKVKRLTVHLKRCRKLGVFPVSFVTTAMLTKKIPPQARIRWQKPGVIL